MEISANAERAESRVADASLHRFRQLALAHASSDIYQDGADAGTTPVAAQAKDDHSEACDKDVP